MAGLAPGVLRCAGTEDELAARPGGVPAHARPGSSRAAATLLPAVARRRAAQRVLAGAARRRRRDAGRRSAASATALRCDMAMLMTNEVFARTWGDRAGPAPAEDYWPALIARVKRAHPDLLFIAEAYWDMEWTLQQQGFDLCYDKRLYDRLAHEGAESVRGHLQADAAYQERLLRFIENHDEPRAAATFGAGAGARGGGRGLDAAGRAAVPRRPARRAPRRTSRSSSAAGPTSPPTRTCARFYAPAAARRRRVRPAHRRVAPVRVRGLARQRHSPPARRVVLDDAGPRHLVVVNLADAPAQARVRLPWDDLAGRRWTLTDRLAGAALRARGDELADEGLYVGARPVGVALPRLRGRTPGRSPRSSCSTARVPERCQTCPAVDAVNGRRRPLSARSSTDGCRSRRPVAATAHFSRLRGASLPAVGGGSEAATLRRVLAVRPIDRRVSALDSQAIEGRPRRW